MTRAVRVLVIGAGAVGLVYAKHLAEGGAEVSVFVRPSRRDEAMRGYTLTRVPMLGARATSRFVPHAVATTADEVRALDVDQAWVATATNALDEPWLAELLAACPRALCVFLQPGDIAARVEALVPDAARRVRGAITFASWESPLPGSADPRETATPRGLAYLVPPLVAQGFEGARADEAVAPLSRGRMRATRTDVTVSLARSSAVLLPHVAALELASWSLRGFGASGMATLAARASREATTIASAALHVAAPLSRALLRGWVTSLAARLVRLVAPFDVETYFRVHFLKVRAQTALILGEHVRDAERLALPADGLRELVAKLTSA